jgi:hypothetical protein
MTLESIVFLSEVEFGLKAGDLFWGHCIVVRMDGSDHFINAHIAE